MAVTVEDGTIVAGANSYIDAEYLKAYAEARGVVLPPAVDCDLDVLLVKATDYLEALWGSYRGSIVDPDQPLQWPRKSVTLFGYCISQDEIPGRLKDAQAELAIKLSTGSEVQIDKEEGEAAVKSIGVFQGIDVEFQDGGEQTALPSTVFAKVYGKLRPLLKGRTGTLIR